MKFVTDKNQMKSKPLLALAKGGNFFCQCLYVLACIIFYISINTLSNPVFAAPIITNTANANFSINDTTISLSDSVQFTKDTVVIPPDVITLQKLADNSSATIGDMITYTLLVNNPNAGTLNNVSIEDTLPTGLVYQAGTAKLNNAGINASQISNTGTDLVISLGNIPANTSWTVSYQVAVTASAPITTAINRAIVKSDTATSTQSQAPVAITAPILPLSLSKLANTSTSKIGDLIRFTLAVKNENSVTINNARIVDILPLGLTYNVGSALLNNNPIVANTSNGLTFTIGNIPASTEWLLTYDTTVTNTATSNTLTNQASVSSDEPKANSGIAKATVEIINGEIQISKKADTVNAKAGEIVIYTVVLNNPAQHELTNLQLEDTLPEGFVYETGTATLNGQIISANNIQITGRTLKLSIGSLAVSESATLSYAAKIQVNAKPGDAVNEVKATSDFASSIVATAVVKVRTPSEITFYKIDESGIDALIPTTSYNSDQNGGKNFAGIDNITLSDGKIITLPMPQPIVEASEYTVLDPVIIEVRDLDQNRDPNVIDTIIVTIHVPNTNDTEVLLLSEISPDSGIFRGVIQSSPDNSKIQNGILTLKAGSEITVHYRDEEDSTDVSATAALVIPETQLTLQKTSDKSIASIGELVRYTLSFRNDTNFTLPTFKIVDTLPLGFRYLTGSVILNGEILNEGITSNGRSLSFALTNMPRASQWTLEYVTKISAGVQIGKAINEAFINTSRIKSNIARATVTIKDDLMRSKNILTGRVYIGCKTKTGKDKIPPKVLGEARIYMETGRSVLSDVEGFWHMEGVNPGAHVLQLDTESIAGYEPILCQDNTRHAKDAKSQFVDLQAGSLWHVDFHVKANEGYTKSTDKNSKKLIERDPVKLFGKEYLESATEGFEILWPKNNYVPAISSTKIVVKSSPQHRVEAFLNGKKISALNYDGSETNKARTVVIKRWVGVDINIKDRNNSLLVILKDKSGKEIDRKTHNIHFSSNPASAELLRDESILVADGKTTPVIALRIKDEEGFLMRANTHGYFTIENNRYSVKTLTNNNDERNLNESLAGSYKYLIEEDGIARIELNPTTQSGEVKLNLSFVESGGNTGTKTTTKRSTDISVWLKPALREWIMVGIAEGTLAHKKLSGNMQTLKDLDKSDEFYKRGRIAFFAKGQVKGKYLLTLAYDTHKNDTEVGSQLNGNIDPDAWYTIYADNSNSQYDAPSSRKLYMKIEKDNFYALFGDFQTGMTVTELAGYERVLNGIKTEYQGERFSYKAFISETSNNHQHDEIPGDGTSGLYKLSANIIPNSETIKIETRDRFHSDRILETRQLTRYQDYNIDYDAGTLFFKFPVTGRDIEFNPNIIVADYDTENDSSKTITAGGRVAIKSFNGRLETGVSALHEGRNKMRDDNLLAADLTYNITEDTTLHAEIAQSKTEASGFDNRTAYIVELEKEIDKMEARLYLKKQDENFGISSQKSESGTEKAGAELKYRVNEKTRINSEISHENNLSNDNKRSLIEVGLEHRYKQVEVNAGVRHTREQFNDQADGERRIDSNTILLGGSYTTKNDKVTLRTDLEKNISSANGSEISPDRVIVGVDVKLKQGFSVFAEHETTDNGEITTHNNRVGVNKDLWKGAKGKTSYTQERTDKGQRNYATLGLSQNIKLSDKISADFSVDQAKTISGNNTPNRFNENEPEIQGTQTDDYTAFSVGLGSNDIDWSWTTRAEYRNGDIEDKINFLASAIRHYENGKNLSAKLSYYNTDNINGDFDKTLKLSFGSAWHPKENDYVFFNRLDLIHEDQNTSINDSNNAFARGSNTNTKKIIHNMHFNRKIGKRSQYSIHHGIKYVEDENSGTKHSTTVDTATVEYRRDISNRWDIGVHGGYLHDWKEKTIETVAGISVGVTPVKNAWAELGYNFEGYDDEDFDKSNFKRKGPYVDFRYKFNQDTIKGDLAIRRKATAKNETKEASIKKVAKKTSATKMAKKAPAKKAIKIVIAEPELETIDQLFNQYTNKPTNEEIMVLNNDK